MLAPVTGIWMAEGAVDKLTIGETCHKAADINMMQSI